MIWAKYGRFWINELNIRHVPEEVKLRRNSERAEEILDVEDNIRIAPPNYNARYQNPWDAMPDRMYTPIELSNIVFILEDPHSEAVHTQGDVFHYPRGQVISALYKFSKTQHIGRQADKSEALRKIFDHTKPMTFELESKPDLRWLRCNGFYHIVNVSDMIVCRYSMGVTAVKSTFGKIFKIPAAEYENRYEWEKCPEILETKSGNTIHISNIRYLQVEGACVTIHSNRNNLKFETDYYPGDKPMKQINDRSAAALMIDDLVLLKCHYIRTNGAYNCYDEDQELSPNDIYESRAFTFLALKSDKVEKGDTVLVQSFRNKDMQKAGAVNAVLVTNILPVEDLDIYSNYAYRFIAGKVDKTEVLRREEALDELEKEVRKKRVAHERKSILEFMGLEKKPLALTDESDD